MSAIKNIKVGETIYDLKALFDGDGNNISETYTKKSELNQGYVEQISMVGWVDEQSLDLEIINKIKSAIENKKIIILDNSTGDVVLYYIVQRASKSTDLLGEESLYLVASRFDYSESPSANYYFIKINLTTNILYLEDFGILTSKEFEDFKSSEFAQKVDKEDGKGLSQENYTTEDKQKLDRIESGANKYQLPTANTSILGGVKSSTTGTTSDRNYNVEVNSDGTMKVNVPWTNTTYNKASSSEDGLMSKEDKQLLSELNSTMHSLSGLEDLYSYGVEWDSTVSDSTLTRIGNPLLHKSLPVQSAYRGCIAKGSEIQYYLYPDNWEYKEDGVTPSVLDGTDGTVRVHTPKFYGKSGTNGTKSWVRISTVKIDDSWVEVPETVIDANRCTVINTVPLDKGYLSTLPVNSAVSVVNTSVELRGGGNRSANDTYLSTDKFRTDLGKPRTAVNRATMRTYAKNAGSELLCYEYYKWIFYWAWVIEYATFNSQATYNEELTAEGYHQGGLGPGVTDWSNAATSWSGYNGTYPITPCGYCNEFGNFTGVKDLVIPESESTDGSSTVTTHTFHVPRWRGFDNPFGDIQTNLDGIILERTAANEPSNVYTTTGSSKFGDDNTAKGNMTIAGIEVATDGYIKEFDLGNTGEIIPSAVGGNTTTYMCDYHYCNVSSTDLRALLVGGSATYGSWAGLASFGSSFPVGVSNSVVGFRTLNIID